MPKISGLKVYPLVREWEFDLDENGASGIRVYQDANNASETVLLPSIGDPWDTTTFPDCRVKRIKVKYPQDNDRCPQQYTCYYETIYIDTQALKNDGQPSPNDKELSISWENSGELITINPSTNSATGYKWKTDSLPVDQAIYKVINTVTVKLQLMLIDITAFTAESIKCEGKLNDAEFLGMQTETVLYTGFTATPWRSETDKAKWRAELTFVCRFVTGDNGPPDPVWRGRDGHNWVIRETPASGVSDWDKPYRDVGSPATKYFLYDTFSFSGLTTTGVENVDLITSTMVPKQ